VLLGLESQAALIFFEKKLTTRRLIYYGCPIIEALGFLDSKSIFQPILIQNTHKNILGSMINLSMAYKNQKHATKPK
jgi:hypothetical protein